MELQRGARGNVGVGGGVVGGEDLDVEGVVLYVEKMGDVSQVTLARGRGLGGKG